VPPLVAIVGPTAAGKSGLALRLARERGGEIVSCDSLQVYRGLDIGSAKATPAERAAVPHHLLDVASPDEPFSAAEYARRARAAVEDVAARGRLPLVVGGTGLYLRALLGGLFEGPSRDEALRRRLGSLVERGAGPRLHLLLARMDPEAAARIEPRDHVRVVRAIEVFRLTGRRLSDHHRQPGQGLPGFRVGVFGLVPEREALRAAVERRTDAMLAGGLVEEVRRLLAHGYGPSLRPLQAIGYRQALAVARGEATVEDARRDIVKTTMQYAKRQMTWFRHQADVHWLPDPDAAYVAVTGWLDGKTLPEAERG
jgi:tRNA dimethylallyltransferase